MNKTLINSSLLLVAISLTVTSLISCSSNNTQGQNTAIGAVAGAVVGGVAGSAIGAGAGQVVAIGAGAVVGALIGGAIGQSMDSTDTMHTYHAMNNHSNHPTTWYNKKTGNRYTVVPTSKRFTINGNPNCRRYRTTAIINGHKQQVHGVACMQANGTWKAVRA